jgi:glyoxylate/hydroxypyruvate reductase A
LPDRPIVRVVDSDLRDRMSEWVVMHALVHLRQLRRYERQSQERVWADDDDQPKAGDVQVGLLGLGVLGMDAAAKLKALGFKVAGWSATPKSATGFPCFSGAGGLDALLAQTDLLVVLLPLTPETRGMLNASLFSRLKQGGPLGGAVLINAGRGGLQVEADILAALESGSLKGASLDVFEGEPLPPESRLWANPAVYVSPHNAAISAPDPKPSKDRRRVSRLRDYRAPNLLKSVAHARAARRERRAQRTSRTTNAHRSRLTTPQLRSIRLQIGPASSTRQAFSQRDLFEPSGIPTNLGARRVQNNRENNRRITGP